MLEYPFTVESLAPAVQAVTEVVEPTDVEYACLVGRQEVATLLAQVVALSAPHVGAAALLDYADELWAVGDPEPTEESPPVEWSRFAHAADLRARASRMVNWDQCPVSLEEFRNHLVRVSHE